MLRNVSLCLFFLILAVASLGQKAHRYSEELATSVDSQLEQHFLHTITNKGWIMIQKAPLNTNQNRFIYVVTHPECKANILVSILSHDASDSLLLSQYLGHADISYLLNGKRVETLPLVHTYIANVQRTINNMVSAEKRTHPLLLAVAGPIEQYGCSLPLF